MTTITAQIDCDETDNAHGVSYEGDATARLCNDAAENGCEQNPGPLAWLNSARVTTDPSHDAVHCVVSVGDPRGGFGFTVRRLSDGRIVIHTPYPGQGMPHMELAPLHPGTMVVVHHGTDKPVIFRDELPDGDHELPSGAVVTFASGRPVSVDLQGEDPDDVVGEIRDEFRFAVTLADENGSYSANAIGVLASRPVD